MNKKESILKCIAEHGPITATEIKEEVNEDRHIVSGMLSQAIRKGLAHIAFYKRELFDGRLYPRPYYKIGPAPKGHKVQRPPPLTHAEYRANKKALQAQRINNVFAMAVLPRRRTMKKRKKFEDTERYKILRFIEAHGPICSAEVAHAMKLTLHKLQAQVSGLKTQGKIYLHSYVREELFGRTQIRPLYALGPAPEGYVEPKRPRILTQQETNARYREKRTARVSSVFDLGKPQNDRRMTTRTRPDMVKEAV